jgi:N-acetylglucosaminyl-diphospho-decaprenol L-rhamnosyltransferase
MILSVVIVSYNVKFFLEQCLSSLSKAAETLSLSGRKTEVFVVDNASSDGTVDFLQPLFPSFHFIRNSENIGFAKANNQVLPHCKGEFVLFLNPDTILSEDSLSLCVDCISNHPKAGSLGPRMIDGSGNFLRESKRGFPSPAASFYKMTGIARLFPHSKTFSAYYAGHIDEKTPHPVPVLSGAFMLIRKTVLDEVGGFDERFFMYAEDIDLSYRISQAGYVNYYFPGTTIIHFKGESTRKDFRYIFLFYKAMHLFITKHFTGARSSLRLLSLGLGIRIHKAAAYCQVLLGKNRRKKRNPLKIFVNGDPLTQQAWIKRLKEKQFPVVNNEKDAEEIIFCESANRSWKSIIGELSEKHRQIVYKFHGTGTHAAVGSCSSRNQGEVFELQS